jgi:hypothetical protein
MKENMYEILKKAAKTLKDNNIKSTECFSSVHGKFVVTLR